MEDTIKSGRGKMRQPTKDELRVEILRLIEENAKLESRIKELEIEKAGNI